jgi:hypothetical protein
MSDWRREAGLSGGEIGDVSNSYGEESKPYFSY